MDVTDNEIARRIGVSSRTAKALRLEAGITRKDQRPPSRKMVDGMRRTNMLDDEIADLYRGERYG
jgi:hypothetical protein